MAGGELGPRRRRAARRAVSTVAIIARTMPSDGSSSVAIGVAGGGLPRSGSRTVTVGVEVSVTVSATPTTVIVSATVTVAVVVSVTVIGAAESSRVEPRSATAAGVATSSLTNRSRQRTSQTRRLRRLVERRA